MSGLLTTATDVPGTGTSGEEERLPAHAGSSDDGYVTCDAAATRRPLLPDRPCHTSPPLAAPSKRTPTPAPWLPARGE